MIPIIGFVACALNAVGQMVMFYGYSHSAWSFGSAIGCAFCAGCCLGLAKK